MPRLVDLTKKPYNLSPDQIKWVEDTLTSMTPEEKTASSSPASSGSAWTALVATL